MASHKKKNQASRDQRRIRTQQIIFTVIAAMMILTMIIGLIAK